MYVFYLIILDQRRLLPTCAHAQTEGAFAHRAPVCIFHIQQKNNCITHLAPSRFHISIHIMRQHLTSLSHLFRHGTNGLSSILRSNVTDQSPPVVQSTLMRKHIIVLFRVLISIKSTFRTAISAFYKCLVRKIYHALV